MARTTFLILLLALPVRASGGRSSTNSYLLVSADGTRLCVMVSPDPRHDGQPVLSLPDGRLVNARDTFGKSGVYDASSLAPLWQVEWYEFDWNMHWSSDLRHIVRRNLRAVDEGDWALRFYEDGRVVRTYHRDHLFTGLRSFVWMPYTTWDWHTQWYEDFSRMPDGREVTLSTHRRRLYFGGRELDLGWQEFYTFDLATGRIVAQRCVGVWRPPVYAVTGMALLVLPPYGLRVAWKKLKARHRAPGFPVARADAHHPADPPNRARSYRPACPTSRPRRP